MALRVLEALRQALRLRLRQRLQALRQQPKALLLRVMAFACITIFSLSSSV
jgi:hypothetical protein